MEPKQTLRRSFMDRHCELACADVLEIGALDEPTAPELTGVRYLDWFSTEQLRAAHATTANRHADRIVEVDYVVCKKRFSDDVAERFDVVIANHVIEHIADPIAWLHELARITTATATLFLAVPDRNFTFDFLRSESTAVDLLRAHDEGLERPDVWQILDSLYHHRQLRAADFWDRPFPAEKLARRFTFDEAIALARRHAAKEYADVHCFVYTAASFPGIMEALREADLTAWEVREIAPVAHGHQEFLVCLTKSAQV